MQHHQLEKERNTPSRKKSPTEFQSLECVLTREKKDLEQQEETQDAVNNLSIFCKRGLYIVFFHISWQHL